jgi:hypothetical protein
VPGAPNKVGALEFIIQHVLATNTGAGIRPKRTGSAPVHGLRKPPTPGFTDEVHYLMDSSIVKFFIAYT